MTKSVEGLLTFAILSTLFPIAPCFGLSPRQERDMKIIRELTLAMAKQGPSNEMTRDKEIKALLEVLGVDEGSKQYAPQFDIDLANSALRNHVDGLSMKRYPQNEEAYSAQVYDCSMNLPGGVEIAGALIGASP